MADPRFQIINLEDDDDIPIIRDRLEWATAEHVLLVVPFRNRTLHDLVNLKLVLRLAQNAGRKLALVSNDPRLIEVAREVRDVQVFSSVKRAQRSRWLAGALPQTDTSPGVDPKVVRVPIADAPDVAPPAVEAKAPPLEVQEEQTTSGVPGVELPPRPKIKVIRPRNLPRFRFRPARPAIGWSSLRRRLLKALAFLVLLVVLAGLMGVVLLLTYPAGEIRLKPAQQPVRAELELRANPEIDKADYATHQIPARRVQVELRHVGRMQPESTSHVPTERARGSVTFINLTSQMITIPVSTTVSTSGGNTILFTTEQTATLEATLNARAQVPIIAVDPGPIGNVGAQKINTVRDLVLARQVAVINETGTSGGDVAPAGVVSKADKERLWANVLQELHQEGYSRLVAELKEQEFIPIESVRVLPLDAAYTPSLDGEVTDLLTLEMRSVVRATAIAGEGANQLALAALQAELPAGYEPVPVTLKFVAGDVIEVSDNGVVAFKMHAEGMARARLDTDIVASEVRGLTLDQARQVLSQRFPLAGDALVSVEPDWLGRLPFLPFRIYVIVEQ